MANVGAISPNLAAQISVAVAKKSMEQMSQPLQLLQSMPVNQSQQTPSAPVNPAVGKVVDVIA